MESSFSSCSPADSHDRVLRAGRLLDVTRRGSVPFRTLHSLQTGSHQMRSALCLLTDPQAGFKQAASCAAYTTTHTHTHTRTHTCTHAHTHAHTHTHTHTQHPPHQTPTLQLHTGGVMRCVPPHPLRPGSNFVRDAHHPCCPAHVTGHCVASGRVPTPTVNAASPAAHTAHHSSLPFRTLTHIPPQRFLLFSFIVFPRKAVRCNIVSQIRRGKLCFQLFWWENSFEFI